MLKQSLYRFLLLLSISLLLGAAQVASFDISGLDKLPRENVEHRLADLYAHPIQGDISEDELMSQVKKALTPYGYFSPSVTIKRPKGKHPGKIHVNPGRPVIITSLTIKITGPGQDNEEINKAYRELPIKINQPFNSILYETSKNNLINAAENQGFLTSRFDQATVMVDKKNNQASIILQFNTGPRSYFGHVKFITGTTRPTPKLKGEIQLPVPKLSKIIEFFKPFAERNPMFTTGHIALSPDLLFAYVPFKYDDAYSTDDMMALHSNLMGSGYFKTIDVDPLADSGHNIPLDVHLEPVDRFSYTLSGGYGTDTGARGRFGLHIVPLNTYGHKFDAVAQGSSNQNAALLKYTIPGRDPIHDKHTINGGFNNLNYVSGNSRSGNLAFVYEHLTSKYQQVLSLNGLHEQFHYDKQKPTERTVVYPKALLTWRQASDPLFSPSGYNLTVGAFAANRYALSSISVGSISVDARAALTIDLIRTRIYAHVMGELTQINDIYTLPLSLAPLLGGPENMKGFSFNSIGPGKVLAYGGLELQKEMIDTWYLLGFIDKGTVYSPTPKEVQYDVGVGLMWRSPVGPIKAAVAQPVDSRLNRMPNTGIRFVVNMGPEI